MAQGLVLDWWMDREFVDRERKSWQAEIKSLDSTKVDGSIFNDISLNAYANSIP